MVVVRIGFTTNQKYNKGGEKMLERFLKAWDDTCKNLPTSTAKIAYLVGYNRAMLNCYLDGLITYDEVQKMSRRIDAIIVTIIDD